MISFASQSQNTTIVGAMDPLAQAHVPLSFSPQGTDRPQGPSMVKVSKRIVLHKYAV